MRLHQQGGGVEFTRSVEELLNIVLVGGTSGDSTAQESSHSEGWRPKINKDKSWREGGGREEGGGGGEGEIEGHSREAAAPARRRQWLADSARNVLCSCEGVCTPTPMIYVR